jgi:hypothetical protein
MAKAKPKATTAWIGYSEAKALAGEYLGDPDFAEREIRRGLATGEIPCQCARFEAPEGYSGPGPDDPKFWKFDGQQCTRDGAVEIYTWREIHIEGNSAIRTDDAAAYGIELDRDSLVRLKLLPPDDANGDSDGITAKVSASRVASAARKKRRQPQVDRILQAIPVVFLNGDIEEISNAVVEQKVTTYLRPETKKGLALPSPDSFARALHQYRARYSST